MRWDDIELLRLIDSLEASGMGGLSTAFQLMERASEGKTLDYQGDPAPFAREILLAQREDLLTFDDQSRFYAGVDSTTNAHLWLQHVQDVRLTIRGRDRARGIVVIQPPPDPSEDDGRPIAGLTLEDIARTIGDTYLASQLPQFLEDSGIPAEFIPRVVNSDRWEYILSALDVLLHGGSASRRSLRAFIGGWLSNQLGLPPNDKARRRIVARLGQQGWHVVNGNLIVGDRTESAHEVLSPLSRDARIAALHVLIRQAADRYLEVGHMEVAIFEAFKAVNNRVREASGLDLDGADLMHKAFRDDDPPLRLANLDTETGRDIQAGFRFIFAGAVRGIRNPDAHQLFEPLNEEEAFERLGLASLLLRRLDGLRTTSPPET